jgi:hypothetical protein
MFVSKIALFGQEAEGEEGGWRGRHGLCPLEVQTTIDARTKVGGTLKEGFEGSQAMKTNLPAGMFDRSPPLQQFFCLFYAEIGKVLVGGSSVYGLEKPDEVVFGKISLCGNNLKVDAGIIMLVHK